MYRRSFIENSASDLYLLRFTCMRGDTEKIKKNFSIEPISANPRIVLCSVVYRFCIERTLV